jgi:hypothetical protein
MHRDLNFLVLRLFIYLLARLATTLYDKSSNKAYSTGGFHVSVLAPHFPKYIRSKILLGFVMVQPMQLSPPNF